MRQTVGNEFLSKLRFVPMGTPLSFHGRAAGWTWFVELVLARSILPICFEQGDERVALLSAVLACIGCIVCVCLISIFLYFRLQAAQVPGAKPITWWKWVTVLLATALTWLEPAEVLYEIGRDLSAVLLGA